MAKGAAGYLNLRELIKGGLTYIPFMRRLLQSREETGGTGSARYCYSVWLRHLVLARAAGCDPDPKVIAELGPGDSLGIGLAGLLSGAERYFGLDVVRFADLKQNRRIFDELVQMFRDRAPIPGDGEFPDVLPRLDDYAFPGFLDRERMERALEPSRLALLRRELEGNGSGTVGRIAYFVPWDSPDVVRRGSVDMVFSQAVLEHVEALPGTYRALALWLKPDGFMTHTIDFKAHHTSGVWNGHWAYNRAMWTLIKGKRVYLLNRQPRSAHLRMMADAGFNVIHEAAHRRDDGLPASRLAKGFRDLSLEDAITAGTFLIARPGAGPQNDEPSREGGSAKSETGSGT